MEKKLFQFLKVVERNARDENQRKAFEKLGILLDEGVEVALVKRAFDARIQLGQPVKRRLRNVLVQILLRQKKVGH